MPQLSSYLPPYSLQLWSKLSNQPNKKPNTPPFNEEAWIKLIFLLSDTQDWLNELANGAVSKFP